jgi:hypothetical protein
MPKPTDKQGRLMLGASDVLAAATPTYWLALVVVLIRSGFTASVLDRQ